MTPCRSPLARSLLLLLMLALPATTAWSQGQKLESLEIPADQNRKWSTRTVLRAGVPYVIEAQGVFDPWGTQPQGVDAVWCFKEPSCSTHEAWQQLRVNGVGLADLARATQGPDYELPYSEQHIYRVQVTGEDRPLEVWLWDSVENRSFADNIGALTVTLYGPGQQATETRPPGLVVLATPTTRPLATATEDKPQAPPQATAEGPATAAGSQPLTAAWIGLERDVVGAGSDAAPDGQPDGHFRLQLDGGNAVRTVDYIALYSADAAGTPSGNQVWDTRPNEFWILGVERANYRLNPRDGDIADQIWGKATYNVFAADSGWFNPGQSFLFMVHFKDGAKVTALATIPPTNTGTTPESTPATPGAPAPTAAAHPAGPPAAVHGVFVGLDRDAVGSGRQPMPDGIADGRFRVVVDTGGGERTLDRMRLESLGGVGGQAWDTDAAGGWFLAVEQDDRRLNAGDGGIADRVSGRATYDAYAGDAGLFKMGRAFRLTVRFADGGEATTEVRIGEGATGGVMSTLPASLPAAAPANPPASPSLAPAPPPTTPSAVATPPAAPPPATSPATSPGAASAPGGGASYRSRWDQIGGDWSTGWLTGNAQQACTHAFNCNCHGQNFCGSHPTGAVTFFWPEGCDRPAWMIRCLAEPKR
jgi:hypothetical protein